MEEQKFKIEIDAGTIGRTHRGEIKKLVKVSWYDKPAIWEIRSFSESGEAYRRPSLTTEDLKALKTILNKMDL